jgi:cation diffusion facilitator family transporter
MGEVRGGISLNREQIIIRTSVVGIVANVLLAAFKAVVGVLSGSIAVVLDAVNNLSDALSSIITIIGTRLAGKMPDRKHPFGHGRIEFLTTVVISVIILYAGLTSLTESVKKILQPTQPDYNLTGLVIIAVAVVVKLVLGAYVKGTGERVKSDTLVASGEDARLDAVISASTLAAALIFLRFHISLEAWLGAVISVVIVKSGVEMIQGAISQILGERLDTELTNAVTQTVLSFPEVEGAYDLILHDYGPNTIIGSIHIEIPDTMDVTELSRLERHITERVMERHGVVLTGISIYVKAQMNTRTGLVMRQVRKIVMAHEDVIQMHGFSLDEERRELHFDIIIDYDVKNRAEQWQEITNQVRALFPDYHVDITLDADATG